MTAISGLMAMHAADVSARHARQMRQLAELSRLTGRAEEDIATEFVGQRLPWREFHRAKLWEIKRGKP